ncbi:MAG: hypothetical protein V4687_05530 [Bacteroidota bacterium]
MIGKLDSPLDIWDLYKLSSPTELNLWAKNLRFRTSHQDDEMFVFASEYEVVTLVLGNGLPKSVSYRPKTKLAFVSFIDWVAANMDYEEVFHEIDENADAMRLDNSDFTLFYMYLPHAPEILSYKITLQAKLAPYDPSNRVEVAIASPPPSSIVPDSSTKS